VFLLYALVFKHTFCWNVTVSINEHARCLTNAIIIMPIRTSNEETQYLDKYGYRSFFSRISTGIKPWDLLSSQTVPEIRYNPNILLLQLNYFQGWYQGRARGTTAPYRKWYPHCKVKNYFFGDFWHLKYPENNTSPLVRRVSPSRRKNPGANPESFPLFQSWLWLLWCIQWNHFLMKNGSHSPLFN